MATAWVVLLLGGVGFWLYYGQKANQMMRGLRQRGEPTSLAEVRLPAVPAGENAAVDYERLIGPPGPYAAKRHLGELTDQQLDALQPPQLGPTETAAIRQVLRDPRVRQTLDAVQAAAAKPHYIRPLPMVDGYLGISARSTDFRTMARICRYVAEVEANDGQMATAGDLLLTGLRITRQMDDEPTVIAFLVATAMQAIAVRGAQEVLLRGELPLAQSEAIQKETDALQPAMTLVSGIRTECAASLDAYERCARSPWMGAKSVRGFIVLSRPPRIELGLLSLLPPYWKRQQMLLIRLADQAVAAIGLPLVNVDAIPDRWGCGNLDLADWTAAVWPSCARKVQDRQAALRLLQLALKLNDFHVTRRRHPNALAELPGPLPQDPFSGKPFLYRNEGASFLLYSVGHNGRDDGGMIVRFADREKAGDMVWGTRNHQPPL